jgi:hypothetical protein
MDPDLNKYDLEHAVTDHPNMSRAELQAIYQEAWSLYYSPAHIETLLRRAVVSGIAMLSLIKVIVAFMHMVPVEHCHPLQAGVLRRKHRSERRYGLPRESVWAFYANHITATIRNNLKLVRTIFWILRLKRRIEREGLGRPYMDAALTPVAEHDEEVLDLFTKTAGAKAAMDHFKKVAALTH